MLRQGDTAKAVFNLGKAIALQSNDPEMYFTRAELYERVSEALKLENCACNIFNSLRV